MINKGNTLIEVLVSSLLLVIVIVGVMFVYANSTSMLIRNKNKGIALRYLNNEIEVINNITNTNTLISKVKDYSGEGKIIIDAKGNVTDYRIKITNTPYLISSISNTVPNLYNLNFTIKWGLNTLSKQLISNPGFE